MANIAIACQGGGSQTAFTAGVLTSFFQNKVHEKDRIVGFSGTSGGAICAALAWSGLLKWSKNKSVNVTDITQHHDLLNPVARHLIEQIGFFHRNMFLKMPPDNA